MLAAPKGMDCSRRYRSSWMSYEIDVGAKAGIGITAEEIDVLFIDSDRSQTSIGCGQVANAFHRFRAGSYLYALAWFTTLPLTGMEQPPKM